MRPGPRGPGSPLRCRRTCRRPSRFNEARAARPWKLSSSWTGDFEEPGFNEARAARPWKCATNPPGRPVRPRRFNEARAARPWKLSARTSVASPRNSLQYSSLYRRCSGFNEARAARPWKSPPHIACRFPGPAASMRPGPRGPGSFYARPDISAVWEASMRPGPRGPGSYSLCAKLPAQSEASMRPGPRGPGSGGRLRRYLRAGRSFNEARAARPWKCFGIVRAANFRRLLQ